ncbi:type IV secretory system conjugative DNA transfer family protein [Eubacteriales bacterium OttesenSCG-928-K08]|nr:type IV secretory system conjugative DNA transfer family protein [Eubacteriales bacterium OttesenSCG-928-K08]
MGSPHEEGIKIFLSIIRAIFKPVLKLLWFTGLIFPVIYSLWFEESELALNISWILAIILFIVNIVRWWGKKGAHPVKEKKRTQPKVNDILTSDTPHGVIFGRKQHKYIVKPEGIDGHVLTVGGVGSGKSSCIAIPTLKGWNERVFVIDIKGELYENSSKERQAVKVFNPLDEHSCGFDPYYLLKTSHNPPQEAKAIAQAIIPLPPDVKDPFWIESAQNILTAAILHYSSLGLSFLKTVEAMLTPSPAGLIEELSNSPQMAARLYVSSFVDADNRLLSSVMTELDRNIIPFVTDRNLISCLSRKRNITPANLERGYDIFVHIPEHLLRQWKPLLTLIVNQFLTYFERRDEKSASPILFLLDEFPRLGKISAMLDGLATLRSKKITICLIIQSLAQLDTIYGTNARKVIADTCAYKAILGATDAETQEYFSRLVGTFEKTKHSKGTQTDPYLGTPRGKTKSTTTEEKRIIKPEEFATLNDIVLLTPYGYCRVDKAPYYSG